MKIDQQDEVVLVSEQDEPIGTMEKMAAHREGLLHRAFSVFIFNKRGEMLLQKRAAHKYHSGGLWTNACCSHPRPGEKTLQAAMRRLNEELGFETTIEKAFDFVYKTEFANGLTEYEFDHVFTGVYNDKININPDEVSEFCYKKVPEIKLSIELFPEKFTAWFILAFPKIEKWWKAEYGKQLSV